MILIFVGDSNLIKLHIQVLQTDIESHGRIVKLVLSLCEDLTHNPGLYDLQHAVKVAKGLEKRWHHIWLRSLEWQCLLEQWIQDPLNVNLNQASATAMFLHSVLSIGK